MRFGNLILWELRFQAKYGFYLLYAVITVIYVIVLFAVPENWKEKTAAILIFSDPAAMGLFFMGAIVLLEKSQRLPCAYAVSPIHPMEYIAAKVIALSVISLAVAAVLALAAGVHNIHVVLLGTVISSTIFTLLGMMIATNIISLNQFILWTAPVEIACFVPAVLHVFQLTPAWLSFYPVNTCMEMISGNIPSVSEIIILMIGTAMLFVITKHYILNMWRSTGGVKL